MLEVLGEPTAVALIGLLGGIALGLAARLGRFCTLGAIEDALYGGDDRRLRMWAIALGVAVAGVHLAEALGHADPGASVYLGLGWNPLATVLGGLMFGYGMALSGNCGYGALARLGGGDLRSLMIVVVMGLAAYFVMSGPLAHARVRLFPMEIAATPQGLGPLAERLLAWPPVATGLVVGAALVGLGLSSRHMRHSAGHVFWAAVVGLAIVSGWVGTSIVAGHGFGAQPVNSHSFAGPLGETMLYAMTASGSSLSFGVGSVVGVVLGAFAGSLFRGQFRWEACDDPRELRRQMGGAALMGVGAVLAIGCSVGQGLSAFSVLAYGAPVAAVSIFVGTAIGLHHLIEGHLPAE